MWCIRIKLLFDNSAIVSFSQTTTNLVHTWEGTQMKMYYEETLAHKSAMTMKYFSENLPLTGCVILAIRIKNLKHYPGNNARIDKSHYEFKINIFLLEKVRIIRILFL